MFTRSKVVEILRKQYPYLRDNFEVKKIALFGSFAKGIEKESSDVDILIEFDKPIGLKFIKLAEYLEEILNKKVDILTWEGIKAIRVKETAADIKETMFYV